MNLPKKIDYDFNAITPLQYEVGLTFKVEGKFLSLLFGKAREKLARKKGITVGGDLKVINKFNVDERYHNYLKANLRGVMKNIYNQLKIDGIEILTNKVKVATFERKEKEWKITIIMEGDHADKR